MGELLLLDWYLALLLLRNIENHIYMLALPVGINHDILMWTDRPLENNFPPKNKEAFIYSYQIYREAKTQQDTKQSKQQQCYDFAFPTPHSHLLATRRVNEDRDVAVVRRPGARALVAVHGHLSPVDIVCPQHFSRAAQ